MTTSRHYERLVVDAVRAFGLSGPVYQFVATGDPILRDGARLARHFLSTQPKTEAARPAAAEGPAGRPDAPPRNVVAGVRSGAPSAARRSPTGPIGSPTGFLCVEVDAGVQLGRIPFPNGAARTVICFGSLAATSDNPAAAAELARLLQPGGALLVGMPLGGSEDGRPCWQRSPSSIQCLLRGCDLTLVGWGEHRAGRAGGPAGRILYGVGFKAPLSRDVLAACGQFGQRSRAAIATAWVWPDRVVGGWLARLLAAPPSSRVVSALLGLVRRVIGSRSGSARPPAGFSRFDDDLDTTEPRLAIHVKCNDQLHEQWQSDDPVDHLGGSRLDLM